MMVAEQCIDPNVVGKKTKEVIKTSGEPTKADILALQAKGHTLTEIQKAYGISQRKRRAIMEA